MSAPSTASEVVRSRWQVWAYRLALFAVIVVLAAIVVLAVVVNLRREVCGVVDREVRHLGFAMVEFNEKFNSLPPNGDSEERLRRFVRKAFPQARGVSARAVPEQLDAAEALVFWLSGVSTDPRDPFAKDAGERYVFFEFPSDRVRDGRFYPKADGETDPYVYFDWEDYDGSEYRGFRPYYWPQDDRRGNREYSGPETCQIVGPGKDGKLGRGGSMAELSAEDLDNEVSFDARLVGEIAADRNATRTNESPPRR